MSDKATPPIWPEWRPISEEVPPLREEVLLCWNYADSDADPIIRLGSLVWPVLKDETPFFKIETDFGDHGGWHYTNRKDPPQFWLPLPPSPKE